MMRLAPNELRYLLGRVPRAESGRHLPPNLKRILVTGAAGSIGGGIVEALAARAEVEVLAHDIVEGRWPRGVTSCRGDLLDISDDVDVGEIDAVIHAAALKDVCPLEADPAAAWRTNVEGSLACARLAKERGAELFLQVSTDKAADPAGVMGASKRLAEIRLLREFAGEPMRVVCLRLPNVLGSSGSILPILRDRLAEGRSLPLRDPDSTRYYLAMEETVAALIAAMNRPGGLYAAGTHLEAMPLSSLFERVVSLWGGESLPQIEVEGLGPGEKKHEVLHGFRETLSTTGADGLAAITTVDDSEQVDELMAFFGDGTS